MWNMQKIFFCTAELFKNSHINFKVLMLNKVENSVKAHKIQNPLNFIKILILYSNLKKYKFTYKYLIQIS